MDWSELLPEPIFPVRIELGGGKVVGQEVDSPVVRRFQSYHAKEVIANQLAGR
jgi:hypothetical protein